MEIRGKQFRFTHRDIERLSPCPEGSSSKADEYSDTDVTGLRITVNKVGRKFWLLRYTVNGRKRAIKLGEFPALDVVGARKRALEIRGQLDRGIDPQEERDQYREMPTFLEFAERDYMPLARQTKRSFMDDDSRLRHHLLPRFGHKKLSDITTREIQSCVGEIAKSLTPATSNRVLSLISRMLKLATVWGLIERNPCVGITKSREARVKERYLTNEEIGRLFRAMDADKNQTVVAALKLLLLTGLRKNEVLKARWDQFDERGLLHLPLTKAGKPRTVTLSQEAMKLLHSLPSRGVSEWIFPGRFSGPVDNVDKCFRRLLIQAGVSRMRVHDLRHTHASILANNGVSLYTIQTCLGHSSPNMTVRYSHLCDASLRQAGDVVGSVVSGAVSAGDSGIAASV